MTAVSRTSLLLASLGAIWLAGSSLDRPSELAAAEPTGHLDTDGDMLPDALEWVLMSDPTKVDSDGDGEDDFLSAVQHGMPAPKDHEMRVAVHAWGGGLYLDLMVRWFPGEDPGDVVVFLETQQQRMSINHVFLFQLAELKIKSVEREGDYLFASARLCDLDQVKPLLPCTLGVDGSIGGKQMASGIVLDEVDGEVVGLVPLPDTYAQAFALHPIDGGSFAQAADNEDGPGSGNGTTVGGPRRFWQGSKTCEMQLVPVGSGGGSTVTEVSDARCSGAPTLRCAPSCADWTGKIYVIGDLLPYLIRR